MNKGMSLMGTKKTLKLTNGKLPNFSSNIKPIKQIKQLL